MRFDPAILVLDSGERGASVRAEMSTFSDILSGYQLPNYR